MEYTPRSETMMKRAGMILLFVSFLIPIPSHGQKTKHFYNVDKEITVEGNIHEIIMEPRYKETSPFLVVLLEEKTTKKLYQVEISPVWFFDHDFHKGENLKVKGSHYSSDGKSLNIIAREVQCRGETFFLRDKHGFPNWRGGKGQLKRRGKDKGKLY
jgi:hypothetical protein